VDEYQLEIQSLRRTLARLRADLADPALIDEYEAEVRNLTALYDAARATLAAGRADARLRNALAELGFGDWNLVNVYSYVYDAAMDIEVDDGHELASVINETDYAASLLDDIDA